MERRARAVDRRLAAAALAALAAGASAPAQAPAGPFVGPATCDATSCHGGTRPADGRIARDEFPTWFRHDRHRKGFEVLASPLGNAMGERLGVDVVRAPECLACHAVPAAAGTGASAASFAEFGVSCEACHGAATGWYGTHFQPGWNRADAVARGGLRDLQDPIALAESCLGCHLGDGERAVDHRLLAAGHPELTFELGTYLLEMPPHWRARGSESRAWHARAVLVGQVVALREQMEAIARDAERGKEFPDYAGFECASCHHDLHGLAWDALREWRQTRGGIAPPGRPTFDASRRASALAALAAAAAPDEAVAVAAAVERVERCLAEPAPARDRTAAAAREAAAACDRAARSLAAVTDTAAAADATAAALARDAETIAAHGVRGAEQAARLLFALRVELAPDAWRRVPGACTDAIERDLFPLLERLEDYSPVLFARRFAALPAR